MKDLYTIIVLIVLGVHPVTAQWTQPCNIIDDELAITIETGSYSGVSVEVTDVDEDSSATYTFPHSSAYTDAVPPVKRGNCDWIAQTNGAGGTYPNVVELAPNTIYLFDFKESNVVTASFLYVACTYPVPSSLSFYCGIDTGGQTNALTDLYVIYSPGGNAFEAHMKGFQESFDITSAFSDDNWMMPHDMHWLCSAASPSDMEGCMDGNELKIFLSGQRNPQSLTHTAADLIVSAGTGWSHSWTMDGARPAGDVELKMTSGTGMIVRGDLDLENVTIAGVSGGSWDGVDFDAGSSGNLSYTSVSGAGITVSNADVSIDHSTLTGTTGTAISVTGSSAEVDVSYTQISGYSEGTSFTSTAFGHLGFPRFRGEVVKPQGL